MGSMTLEGVLEACALFKFEDFLVMEGSVHVGSNNYSVALVDRLCDVRYEILEKCFAGITVVVGA